MTMSNIVKNFILITFSGEYRKKYPIFPLQHNRSRCNFCVCIEFRANSSAKTIWNSSGNYKFYQFLLFEKAKGNSIKKICNEKKTHNFSTLARQSSQYFFKYTWIFYGSGVVINTSKILSVLWSRIGKYFRDPPWATWLHVSAFHFGFYFR